ncbi:MAG: hypothetical protein WAO55_08325 [Candidatus Manganitrophaceae bacterium]
MLRLYRHPIVVGAMVTNAAQFILKLFPATQFGVGGLHTLSELAWLPAVSVGIVLAYLGIEFFFLSPRSQFVPPRLSIHGIDQMVLQQVTRVGATSGELAVGGAAVGGVGALFLFPEPVTLLIATVLGALFGLAGNDLQEMKKDATKGIMLEFDTALSQLDRAMDEWCESTSATIMKAAEDSFGENIEKLTAQLDDRQVMTLLLPSARQP